MKRAALIIGSPDEMIPAVRQDMVNYREFFLSALGGAWQNGEIQTLESPTRSAVDTELERIRECEYSIIIFAGHGRHLTGTDSTIVQLRPGVEMDANALKVGAPKRTLVLDCCRVHSTRRIAVEGLSVSLASFSEGLDPNACRLHYDRRIAECAPGLVSMYACAVGQVANETHDGGEYSSALMKSSKDWRRRQRIDTSHNFLIFSVVEAHNQAAEQVGRATGQSQTPIASYPRTERHFPFSVIA